MQTQIPDIAAYLACINWCRSNEWAFNSFAKPFLNLFHRHHTILGREEYYEAVLRLCRVKPRNPLAVYRDELVRNDLVRRNYVGAIDSGRLQKKYKVYEDKILLQEANVVHYYALIREVQPAIVVETGTAAGSMTAWVLAALAANKKGKLISIDLPPVAGKLVMDLTISKADVGFLIPREYHERWEYLMGDAKILLPRVLADNEVDVFIHDSLHTRSHMLFEYNVARCLMKPGKIILSDDILWNRSFFDFVRSHQLTSLACISNPNLGVTVNVFDEYETGIGTDVIRLG